MMELGHYGISVHRKAFRTSECEKIREVLTRHLHSPPDFEDGSGNEGFVVWSRNKSGKPHDEIARVITQLAMRPIMTDASLARALQVNVQQPFGKQEYHTDTPFNSSRVLHLNDNGRHDFITDDGTFQSIKLNQGDVVMQSRGREISHRGRNPSASGRMTVALFFATRQQG